MGTTLQNNGMISGECPESYNFSHEELIYNIHKNNIDAGVDVILTNTFGANAQKLVNQRFSTREVIHKAISIARRAAKDKFVALDIGSIGQLLEPLGTLKFEEAYELFKEQMIEGEKAGADLIVIETMNDIYEAKIAVLAAKENTKLPIICSLTFQDNGRTLTATDPETMVFILEGLGVNALGLNCSLGPEEMMPIVKRIMNVATIPILVKPNAGLPISEKGKVKYKLSPSQFGKDMKKIAELGVRLLGGCCGTTPEYITELRKNLEGLIPVKLTNTRIPVACSSSKSVVIGTSTTMIGERINPNTNKNIRYALKNHDLNFLLQEAIMEKKAGADIIDVNVGIPEIDEVSTLVSVIKEIQSVVDTPLQFDSSNPEALEKAARIYNGKPIINSVDGNKEKMEKIFPIVKKYGTMVVCLTLDEGGIPNTIEKRIEIAEKLINTAKSYGIPKEDLLIDCLVLTASVQQDQAFKTLNAMKQIKEQFKVATMLGVSNISFGLPNPSLIKTTFLTMALTMGLDAAITDPLAKNIQDVFSSFRVLSGQDVGSTHYISKYSGVNSNSPASSMQNQSNPSNNSRENVPSLSFEIEKFGSLPEQQSKEIVNEVVIKGLKTQIQDLIKILLKKYSPMDVIELFLAPALDIVGTKYEKQEIFLPQLINSAEVVRMGFEVLKEEFAISKKVHETNSKQEPIILATVKGDVHDIGKNIVKILLENYGFQVVDLGKDVPIDTVLEATIKYSPKLIGLSALMTTTVENMKQTILELRKKGYKGKIMVGGAVLNPEYAMMIGADYYGKNAWDSVKIAKLILGKD